MRHSTCCLGLVPVVLLSACASPIEIKTASKSQIDAIEALDRGITDLQASIAAFHEDLIERTKAEGRILIAKQAIAVALKSGDTKVTADTLFTEYKKDVQPWIDNALMADRYPADIERLKQNIQKATDPILKFSLTNDLQDLEVRQAGMSAKPAPVLDLEKIILADIANQSKTNAQVAAALSLLRNQLQIMKLMALRVDAWIGTDVTIDQSQIDALRSAFTQAHTALAGGAK